MKRYSIILLAGLTLLTASCGGSTTAVSPTAAPPSVLTQATPAAISPLAPASQVDPCALLTQAEVAAAVGRPVLPPKAEQAANLACCSFGDPEAPIVSTATLCVFVGGDADYFDGAAAQTRAVFEQSKRNAASAEPVSGLGEDAYWDEIFKSLHVLAGPYELSLEISLDTEEDGAALAATKALIAQALLRLPD